MVEERGSKSHEKPTHIEKHEAQYHNTDPVEKLNGLAPVELRYTLARF
jgi:hypothetical protein